ncbi:MAG: 2,3-bisphosphoglycerate-independent phosphoglycerate mutase [Candidatus Nucleicultricaceae bacterium]
MRFKPVVLCILDGWGHRETTHDNSIALASLPHWNHLWSHYPHTVLDASAGSVGLPEGQMGNSEVGHMTIGSGQVIMQDLPRINDVIQNNALLDYAELNHFIETLKKTGGACHLLGLLSPGGVHSHMDHLLALSDVIASHSIKVWVHAFLDGRDTPPQSALSYIKTFEEKLHPNAALATIGGRYYGMDRDKRWDRVQKAYDAMISAYALRYASAEDAIEQAYANAITDEFIEPCVIGAYQGVENQDGFLMGNFRADRARQILEALVFPDFSSFKRERKPEWSATLGLVEYADNLLPYIPVLFKPQEIRDSLGEVVARQGLKQLRIAETEKYAHVTFFFNGGREALFEGEERILIPSPKVATYDLQPEMSALELTDRLIQEIDRNYFDFIVVNYANPDMVGHTGNIAASIKAVETVDACLGKLTEAVRQKGGVLVISADHGNVEEMVDSEGVPLTSHTLNLVPFVVVSDAHQSLSLQSGGTLADIAPTILALMGFDPSLSMTGQSLIAKAAGVSKERISIGVE